MNKTTKLELGRLLDQLRILNIVYNEGKDIYKCVRLKDDDTSESITINMEELEPPTPN